VKEAVTWVSIELLGCRHKRGGSEIFDFGVQCLLPASYNRTMFASNLDRKKKCMLKDFNNDRVTLVKSDGQVEKENIPALVAGDMIFTADQTLLLEVGDHLLRSLPNGLVEDYEITNPKFFNIGSDSHFQINVRKAGAPKEQATVIQGITNHFTGSNARVNINSTDNSINLSAEFSREQLLDFVNQIRPVVPQLPEEGREIIEAQLVTIEQESAKPKPSKISILGALQSIKSVAEGASGNLVAAGIISLITALL
jgi:hypothetical protein